MPQTSYSLKDEIIRYVRYSLILKVTQLYFKSYSVQCSLTNHFMHALNGNIYTEYHKELINNMITRTKATLSLQQVINVLMQYETFPFINSDAPSFKTLVIWCMLLGDKPKTIWSHFHLKSPKKIKSCKYYQDFVKNYQIPKKHFEFYNPKISQKSRTKLNTTLLLAKQLFSYFGDFNRVESVEIEEISNNLPKEVEYFKREVRDTLQQYLEKSIGLAAMPDEKDISPLPEPPVLLEPWNEALKKEFDDFGIGNLFVPVQKEDWIVNKNLIAKYEQELARNIEKRSLFNEIKLKIDNTNIDFNTDLSRVFRPSRLQVCKLNELLNFGSLKFFKDVYHVENSRIFGVSDDLFTRLFGVYICLSRIKVSTFKLFESLKLTTLHQYFKREMNKLKNRRKRKYKHEIDLFKNEIKSYMSNVFDDLIRNNFIDTKAKEAVLKYLNISKDMPLIPKEIIQIKEVRVPYEVVREIKIPIIKIVEKIVESVRYVEVPVKEKIIVETTRLISNFEDVVKWLQGDLRFIAESLVTKPFSLAMIKKLIPKDFDPELSKFLMRDHGKYLCEKQVLLTRLNNPETAVKAKAQLEAIDKINSYLSKLNCSIDGSKMICGEKIPVKIVEMYLQPNWLEFLTKFNLRSLFAPDY
jgi:hypothetical protein